MPNQPNQENRDARLPTVSVLVPAYNHEKYVVEMVESLFAQNYPGLEIVAVDDGSRDATHARLLKLAEQAPCAMRVETQANRGVVKTLNRALSLATGELCSVLASDDLWVPEALPPLARMFAERPELLLLLTAGRHYRKGAAHGKLNGPRVARLLARGREAVLSHVTTHVSPIYLHGALYRTEFLRRAGGWDESLVLDDWPLAVRLFQNLPDDASWAFVDTPLALYRTHGENSVFDRESHYAKIEQTALRYVPEEARSRLLSHEVWGWAESSLWNGDVAQAVRHFRRCQDMHFHPARYFLFAAILLRRTGRRMRGRLQGSGS